MEGLVWKNIPEEKYTEEPKEKYKEDYIRKSI